MPLRSNRPFIELSNLLEFKITLANSGSFEKVTLGTDRSSINRLYVIPNSSKADGSWIVNHSVSSNEKIPLRPGWIYFIPGDISLEFHFAPGFEISAIHFSLETYPGFDIFSDAASVLKTDGFQELNGFIHENCQEQNDLGKISALRSAYLYLASSFCHESLTDFQKFQQSASEFKEVFEYIRKHASAQLRQKELAENFGMRRDQLRKRFLRKTGIQLKAYLDQVLIKRASERLLYSNELIYVIAEELGFSNEYYFSNFFKRHTGQAPSHFRKNTLKGSF